MNEILNQLKNNTEHLKLVFKPDFYRLSDRSDKEIFLQLINNEIFLTDDLEFQLRELLRSRSPKRIFSESDYRIAVAEHLGQTPLEEYGVWVYYPWSKRLVHLLDEAEFIELRTSRNKYKITDEEERILATKKVGVVGLSVGQSVTLTLCMERGAGEIRIADFDTLELTNINRIRSGVHNLGLHKTIIAAREVAEIDPFLKVVPFSEGLTLDNLDRFFTEGGNLDLVIDECDGLDMKIHMRNKAKAMRIPLLMEASDRGMLDVERYDLEPERPLLHGLIDHLDPSRIGSLTSDEKVAFILPFLGVDTISKRLKASMVEVNQSITTWPQLASAVTLGGALCADVCRRILLDHYHESGRYFIDIEELVGDKTPVQEGAYEYTDPSAAPLLTAEMHNFAAALVPVAHPADEAVLRQIAEAGALAPSAGNSQPWQFFVANGALHLFHDREKSVSWFNHEDFIANISFGAALENMEIKAASLGFSIAPYKLYPLGQDQPLVCRIELVAEPAQAQSPDAALAPYVGVRCTNRKKGSAEKPDDAQLSIIGRLADEKAGASIGLLTDATAIREVASIVGAAEKIRFLYPQTHYEFFKQELRWNDTGNEEIREGLDIKTLELTVGDEVGMKVSSDPAVIATLNAWKAGDAFEQLSQKTIVTSAAVGLIAMPGATAEDFVGGGRLLEKIWLHASRLELALHPIAAPLFLLHKVRQDAGHGLSEEIVVNIDKLETRLQQVFPVLREKQGIFLFRISKAAAPTARSLKRLFHEIYHTA